MKWLACKVLFFAFCSLSARESLATESLPATTAVRYTAHGVTLWASDASFEGDFGFFAPRSFKQLTSDVLSNPIAGHMILESSSAIVSISRDGSTLSFWTRRDRELVRRGEVKLDVDTRPAQFKLAETARPGLAIEVTSTDGKRRHTIALSRDSVVQIDQQPGQSLSVSSPIRHLLAPSMIGTDLLYSAADLDRANPSCVVSLNLVVGLLDDCNGVLVAVWPPGQQIARIAKSAGSDGRTIDTLSVDTAGQSFFLAYLEQPEIWHEVALQRAFLEKDTKISWQRPLEARWIGRFHIESDDYSFPFYFLYQKHRLWGRYIRGWFYYPVWFDFTDTKVHFEKKFPPKGKLLIYYLDTYRGNEETFSPLGIMRGALGAERTAELLDLEGIRQRPLLAHGNAVCAMTREIERYFAKDANAPPQSLAVSYANDVATFIRRIRERIVEYDQFAVAALRFLHSETKGNATLESSTEGIEEILREIQDIAREDLPEVTLEEVSGWTKKIRDATHQADESALPQIKRLTQQCRSVAGTQDGMARDLSVAAVRLMEEAASMGTASTEHLRLAEQLIDKTRGVLRQPTWWEVSRRYEPKSNPGAD